MAVSHMPHIRGISIWQRTWCKSVECARVHPPLTSVDPTTYSSIVLGTLCIPAVNDSEGEGFIHIQYFILSSVLWCCKAQTGVPMVAFWGCCNMTQVSVVAPLANQMLGMSHSWPPPLFTQCHFLLTCLDCCIPLPSHHQSDPGSMEGGLWASIVEP